ncbi:hypothetical protein ACOSP7_021133 [Xanthoceras sorbifolium]
MSLLECFPVQAPFRLVRVMGRILGLDTVRLVKQYRVLILKLGRKTRKLNPVKVLDSNMGHPRVIKRCLR